MPRSDRGRVPAVALAFLAAAWTCLAGGPRPAPAAEPAVLPGHALLAARLEAADLKVDTLVMLDTRTNLFPVPRPPEEAFLKSFGASGGLPSLNGFYLSLQPFGPEGYLEKSWRAGRFKKLLWVLPVRGAALDPDEVAGTFLQPTGRFRRDEIALEKTGDELSGAIRGVPVTLVALDRLPQALEAGKSFVADIDLDFFVHLFSLPAMPDETPVAVAMEIMARLVPILDGASAAFISLSEMKFALPAEHWYLAGLLRGAIFPGPNPLKPRDYWDLRSKAQFLASIRQLPAARLIYEDLRRDNPGDAGLLYAYALVLAMDGRHQEALKVMEECVGVDGDYRIGYARLLSLLAATNPSAFDEAVRGLDGSRGLEGLPEAEFELAAVLQGLRGSAPARDRYRKAAAGLKGQVEGEGRLISLMVGDTYFIEGDLAKAGEEYDRGLAGGAELDARLMFGFLPGIQLRRATVAARRGDEPGVFRHYLESLDLSDPWLGE